MHQPTLEYRSASSTLRPVRRTLAHASLVLVIVADCLAGIGYSAAAAAGHLEVPQVILVVGAAMGMFAVAGWLVGVVFACISLVDRDGPQRLAVLALLVAAVSVCGTFLLGRMLEVTRV